jgi:putative SOS response-associated peptidase YedK
MCGRTALTATPEDLRAAFGLSEMPELGPRYNIVPSQPIAVIRTPGKLELLRWGLVPFWAHDAKMGHKLALARAESVLTTPAFREAIRKRRCLVVVSGFYEWQRAGQKTATPFFVRHSDQPLFALAGVWDRWVSKDGEVVESCAVLTRSARPPLDSIHNRMPVVLQRDVWARWFEGDAIRDLASLLEPRDSRLVAFSVSSYVNDPKHDDPRCLAKTEPEQGQLFACPAGAPPVLMKG